MKGNPWTKREDLVAVYLYLFKKHSKEDRAFFTAQINHSDSSLNKRIDNVEWIATEGKKGLSHFAKQTKEVYEAYKDKSQEEIECRLQEEAINISNTCSP